MYHLLQRQHFIKYVDSQRNQSQHINVHKKISSVAWQHINLFGYYEFYKSQDPVNIDEIIHELAQLIKGYSG
ncbi:hypothetical protein J23TS9_13290 [Paenibacillus sp. J23TS9]|nr:hypothetical protein J23TS9_13290 [Paenibacillus sp. J23TS9]